MVVESCGPKNMVDWLERKYQFVPLESFLERPNLAQVFRMATCFDVRVFTRSKVLVVLTSSRLFVFFRFHKFVKIMLYRTSGTSQRLSKKILEFENNPAHCDATCN